MIPGDLGVTAWSFLGHFGQVGHFCLGQRDPLLCSYGTRRLSVMSIDFDVEKLIGKLDIVQKTQLPFAANQALKRLVICSSINSASQVQR